MPLTATSGVPGSAANTTASRDRPQGATYIPHVRKYCRIAARFGRLSPSTAEGTSRAGSNGREPPGVRPDPVVVIAPQDADDEKVRSNLDQVKARGGCIIGVISEDDTELERGLDHVIRIPRTHDMLTPVLASVPLQLLACHIAVLRGANVDQPRNLAKRVTVE
jgi:hypothetical protein